ncbi:MAG TPA: carboxypeptidase-like regulatory domain-containing protein [Longimicrobiales bacterium]|nr:carboxypeptidase-like regulatory domain-containing protein [Longimicrobiales bacterium]
MKDEGAAMWRLVSRGISCPARRRALSVGPLLLVLLSASFPTSSAAQQLVGRVVDAESLDTMAGAMVLSMDAADSIIARTLTNDEGVFVLPYGAGAAPTAVRVERIGYATQTFSEPDFSVDEFAVLRVSSAPVRVEGVTALAESLCGRLALDSQGVVAIWDEVRKGLQAAALAASQRVQTFEIENLARSLEPRTGVVLRGSTQRRRVVADRPYQSISVEKMTEDGWADVAADGVTYYAPDEQILLSDEFAEQHCFNVGESDEGILLSFEPNRGREGLPELYGAMVLDEETLELRYIRFTFDGLPGFPRGPNQAEGQVRFSTTPSGLKTVEEWSLRMPVMTVSPDRSRVRLDYVREVQGRIVDVSLRPDQAAQAASASTSLYAWAPASRLSSWSEDGGEAGVLLYVRNGLSIPVRVSGLELWGCTNVAVDCRGRYDVDVPVEAGETALVFALPRQDADRPAEFRWTYSAAPADAVEAPEN